MRRRHAPSSTAPGTGPSRTGALLAIVILACSAAPASASPAETADRNVLETRTRVAAMAEEAVDMLKSEITLEGVEGWAVFSGDSLPPELDAGVGMAERIDGESYFMRTPARRCLSKGYRHVLVFRDEDMFREFRQGEMAGDALERARSERPDGEFMAFRFRPAQTLELEPLNLSGCRFALHRDLQRALVGEPSETEGLVDDDHVDVDEN